MHTLRLTIELPIPLNGLWPNDRVHWARKARVVRQTRTLAHLVGRQRAVECGWLRPIREANVQTRWLLPGRVRDPDNCVSALKSTLDGLTDAGIWFDDRRLTIHPPVIYSKSDWTKLGLPGPGLTVEITPANLNTLLGELA